MPPLCCESTGLSSAILSDVLLCSNHLLPDYPAKCRFYQIENHGTGNPKTVPPRSILRHSPYEDIA